MQKVDNYVVLIEIYSFFFILSLFDLCNLKKIQKKVEKTSKELFVCKQQRDIKSYNRKLIKMKIV